MTMMMMMLSALRINNRIGERGREIKRKEKKTKTTAAVAAAPIYENL
jgi:hypothetical protein